MLLDAYEQLIRLVVKHSGAKAKTIGNYGVISLGFRANRATFQWYGWKGHPWAQAGVLLRQSAMRSAYQTDSISNSIFGGKMQVKWELLFRQYGLTSTGAYHNSSQDYMALNVQGTNTGNLVDFGSYMVVDGFNR